MDTVTLVQQVTPWLVAAAPYLRQLGELAGKAAMKEVSREAATKIGGLWDGAKGIWSMLQRSESEVAPDVVKAVQDVARLPDDPDTHAALRLQLRKLLSSDTKLKDEIIKIISEAQLKQREASIHAGGNVMNSAIIMGNDNIIGDGNVVQKK
jgi:hypothetical protein